MRIAAIPKRQWSSFSWRHSAAAASARSAFSTRHQAPSTRHQHPAPSTEHPTPEDMCGICGIVHRDGDQPVERAVVDRMMAAMVHRGPDGAGLRVDGPAGLGHRRLSIIDLSDAGLQPMPNEDGRYWIVFNGEI